MPRRTLELLVYDQANHLLGVRINRSVLRRGLPLVYASRDRLQDRV